MLTQVFDPTFRMAFVCKSSGGAHETSWLVMTRNCCFGAAVLVPFAIKFGNVQGVIVRRLRQNQRDEHQHEQHRTGEIGRQLVYASCLSKFHVVFAVQ